MKYYVVEISTGDSQVAGRGIYGYDNYYSAMASFHNKIGKAMNSELFDSELVLVFNEEGGLQASDYYKKPVEEEIV